MKKHKVIMIIGTIALILVGPSVFAESVHLSTYYPAPFGSYSRIRLVPQDSLTDPEFCNDKKDLGTLYYDNGKNERAEGIYVCQRVNDDDEEEMSEEQFDWIFVSRPVRPNSAIIKSGKVACLKSNGAFGVCVNNPSSDGTCGCS